MSADRLTFTVPGLPVPKQRARRGKGGRWYTPEKTANYETAVKMHALNGIARVGWPMRTKSLCAVTIHVYFPDNRNRDIDNVFKACADAMNDFVYHDDTQIHEQHAYKHVGSECPRVEVEVTLLEKRAA
jgi:crossover junction endodeoxyribonuclease RusA